MVSGFEDALAAAEGATVQTAEDVVSQVVFSHNFGDFAVAAAAKERLENGGHAAADGGAAGADGQRAAVF